MFKNIVVAIDGSDHARRALEVACDLAKHYNSRIHLVHTLEPEIAALALGASAYAIPPTDRDIEKAGEEIMAVAAAHAQELGTPASSQIIGNGAPATETLALADKIGADLIVVGRRGLGRIGRLVLGSTSAKIALEAPCAVLTIK